MADRAAFGDDCNTRSVTEDENNDDDDAVENGVTNKAAFLGLLCSRARTMWLSSDKQNKIEEVERIYRDVWTRSNSLLENSTRVDSDDQCSHRSKKQRIEGDHLDEVATWRQKAGEKLSLILLQSQRAAEADKILISLGYTCRLAASILDYNIDTSMTMTEKTSTDPPCRIFDNYLHQSELHMLQTVFLNPDSSYWTHHNYTVEPPSPYFSYLIPLHDGQVGPDLENAGIVRLVHRLQKFLEPYFPVQQASYCEMWAHNRPHATGHQFHFDSDNEGCTSVIRNPICSCIIYLTDADIMGDAGGGPSVITNQRLNSRSLAGIVGWMCTASIGRMVAFDGKVLHGVIPGKAGRTTNKDSSSNPDSMSCHRRVSVMFAFWRKIRIRDYEPGPGAARPFPISTSLEWANQLITPLEEIDDSNVPTPVVVQPMYLDHVYESTADSKQWTRNMGLPSYDELFQGF